jgi:hypothetical protein
MTDEGLIHFSEANRLLRVEREPDGELIVWAPVGTENGRVETDIPLNWVIGLKREVAASSNRTSAFACRTVLFGPRMPTG